MNFKEYFKKNPSKLYQKENLLIDISRMVFVYRSRAGLTQSQLAKKIKTLQPSIARIENSGVASIQMLQKIGNVLGLSLEVKYKPKNSKDIRYQDLDTLENNNKQ